MTTFALQPNEILRLLLKLKTPEELQANVQVLEYFTQHPCCHPDYKNDYKRLVAVITKTIKWMKKTKVANKIELISSVVGATVRYIPGDLLWEKNESVSAMLQIEQQIGQIHLLIEIHKTGGPILIAHIPSNVTEMEIFEKMISNGWKSTNDGLRKPCSLKGKKLLRLKEEIKFLSEL